MSSEVVGANVEGGKVLFLLGAGASYGHMKSPISDTPPLANDFLLAAVKAGVLNDTDYPQLASEIRSRGGQTDLIKCCEVMKQMNLSLELFLESVRRSSLDGAEEAVREQMLRQRWEKMRRGELTAGEYAHSGVPNPAFALETSRFLIQAFIGRFCMTGAGEGSAYRELARFIRTSSESVVGILTLNYDTICESALRSEGIPYDYNLTRASTMELPLLKPHGSVNLRFPLSRIVVTDDTTWQKYVASENTVVQNLTVGHDIAVEMYEPTYSLQDDFWTEPGESMTHLPMLVQPLVDKIYDQVPAYGRVWKKCEQVLAKTGFLVVVGCRMDLAETRLWDCLKKYLSAEAAIAIVGFGSRGLSEIEERFHKQGFKNVLSLHGVEGFRDYALRYLVNGKLK